jgi:P-type E1-E2 ATPase
LVLALTVERTKNPTAWIDGVAILVSVVVVVMVTAINDYQKEQQFQGLQAKQDAMKMAQVLRNGVKVEVSVYDIVVGDILEVEDGMILPADGVLFEGYEIECDESALTGESEAIAKSVSHIPWMLSGTSVQSGAGKMLVTCVGLFSEEGIINRLITGAGEKEAAALESKVHQFFCFTCI